MVKYYPIYKIAPSELGISKTQIGRSRQNAIFSTYVRQTDGKTGVYLIRENRKLIYIGNSRTNIYKTMIRHFQQWNDSEQDRITYKEKSKSKEFYYDFTFLELSEHKTILRTEKSLIKKFLPRDNRINYSRMNNKFVDVEEHKKMTKLDKTALGKKQEKISKEKNSELRFNDKGELIDENGNILF